MLCLWFKIKIIAGGKELEWAGNPGSALRRARLRAGALRPTVVRGSRGRRSGGVFVTGQPADGARSRRPMAVSRRPQRGSGGGPGRAAEAQPRGSGIGRGGVVRFGRG